MNIQNLIITVVNHADRCRLVVERIELDEHGLRFVFTDYEGAAGPDENQPHWMRSLSKVEMSLPDIELLPFASNLVRQAAYKIKDVRRLSRPPLERADFLDERGFHPNGDARR